MKLKIPIGVGTCIYVKKVNLKLFYLFYYLFEYNQLYICIWEVLIILDSERTIYLGNLHLTLFGIYFLSLPVPP